MDEMKRRWKSEIKRRWKSAAGKTLLSPTKSRMDGDTSTSVERRSEEATISKGLGVRGGIERQGLIMRIILYNVIEKHPVCLVLFDNVILSKNL